MAKADPGKRKAVITAVLAGTALVITAIADLIRALRG